MTGLSWVPEVTRNTVMSSPLRAGDTAADPFAQAPEPSGEKSRPNTTTRLTMSAGTPAMFARISWESVIV